MKGSDMDDKDAFRLARKEPTRMVAVRASSIE
jgi:hypothetical protein